MSVQMPDLLNYWTVDSVAECIDGVGQELSRSCGHSSQQIVRRWAKWPGKRLPMKRRRSSPPLSLKSSRRNNGTDYQASAGANEGVDGRL